MHFVVAGDQLVQCVDGLVVALGLSVQFGCICAGSTCLLEVVGTRCVVLRPLEDPCGDAVLPFLKLFVPLTLGLIVSHIIGS